MLLIELQYFPTVITYGTLIKNTNIEFCLYENYQRRSFRNRCIIAGANGPISLSVPIAGGRNKKAVYKDVRIDYSTDWQKLHWRTIFSAYGNSPWFFHYAQSLEKLFSQKAEFLYDWNFLCLDWVNRSIGKIMTSLNSPGVTLGGLGNSWKVREPLEGWGTLGELGNSWRVGEPLEGWGTLGELGNSWRVGEPLEGSENYETVDMSHSENAIEKILDWRNKIIPANFQNKEMGPFPIYTQVFEDRFGFLQNLSILDFVLCCGKGQLTNLLK